MANYFVDFSAANNGDGSDGAQAGAPAGPGAFNQLTAAENVTILAGDSVYLRRTGVASVKTIVFKDGVKYYGWPKATDENYATRPANTVDATWNADGDDWTYFTAPSGAWTGVNIEFWRLRGRRTSGTNSFFEQTGAHENLFWNHCVAATTVVFGNVGISGSISGVGRFKMRDCKLVAENANSSFSINPNNGPSGYIDIETVIECTVANANDFSINLNPNSVATNIMRFVVLDYINTGAARIAWNCSGGSAGMFTMGYADACSQKTKTNAISIGSPNASGQRVRLLNLDQTGHLGATGLTFSGTRDSCFAEAINCKFVGATQDILFTGTSRGRLTGRNVSFDRTKVTFGSNGSVTDPDCQAIFIEGFGGTKGQSFRMNSRGFHLQSSATRTGGANQSILMETRLQGNPVGNPEPFLITDGFGLEYMRAYVTGTKTVRVFIYANNWSGNENKSNIWLEIDYYDQVSGAHVATVSTRDGGPTPAALDADASVWSGVAGGTPYKLEKAITVSQAGYVAIRVCVADSYAPGGNRSQVYVDPQVVVV